MSRACKGLLAGGRRFGLLTVLALLVPSLGVATAAARSTHPATKTVSYRGASFPVPAAWPVYDLAKNPRVCVRFNRHAVYLGNPGSQQRCPAHAVGRMEAILVQPLQAAAARAAGGGIADVLPSPSNGDAQPTQGSSAQVAIPQDGVMVTATWHSNPQAVQRALGYRSLTTMRSAGAAAVAPSSTAASAIARTAAAGSVYTGPGFDACSAPSSSQMSAWNSSRYRGVNVYIGGTNMGCSQPTLTAGWISDESAAGWHMIPTYVGLQSPGNSCGCAAINPSSASSEGSAAAKDAVSRAGALGMGPGNPIYFDMEGYSRGTTAVLNFLAAWTSQLHARGYKSGVYSSGNSGIRDLVAKQGTGYKEPDELWIADWNGVQLTSDPYVPSQYWAAHQRIHQYDGGHNETHGGVTLNIDGDAVDAATAGPGSSHPSLPNGTFIEVTGTSKVYRIAGGAPIYIHSWSSVGGRRRVVQITKQRFSALRRYPENGTFLTTSAGGIYRVAGGAPLKVSSWSVFGHPQPNMRIDGWDIQHIGNPLVRLRGTPTSGTTVEGLPSNTYWKFVGAYRQPQAPSGSAVRVDDLALSLFPMRTPRCVVPKLTHLTLAQTRRLLRWADCRLGTVQQPVHFSPGQVLRVSSQSPGLRTVHPVNYPVSVTLT